MKIMDKLINFSSGQDAVSNLESTIRELETAKNSAQAWLETVDERRIELVLASDDDGLAKLRQEKAIQEERRDGAETALARIRQQLVAARAKAREDRRQAILSKYEPALKRFRDIIGPAVQAAADVMAVHAELEREDFRTDGASLLRIPCFEGHPFLTSDLAKKIDEELGRLRGKNDRPIAPKLRPVQPARRPAPMQVKRPGPERMRAEVRALRNDPAPTSSDYALVEYLRSNVDLPDGSGASLRGDRVAVPAKVAEHLFANMAAVLVNETKATREREVANEPIR